MKTKPVLLLAALCGTCVVSAQNTRPAAPAVNSPTGQTETPANVPATGDLTRAQALKVIEAAKKYEAHPPPAPEGEVSKPKVVMPDFDIATAPPAPRAEVRPDAPGAGMIWVAGHYMPVNGQWRWVRGEWATPPLAISVWIPAKYDDEKKHWYPGYWQPDAPSTTPALDAEAARKPENAAGKTPPRY